ncbi:MAG: hypothetical protein L0229_20245 [Blastocatellia bacterium]|nr:hypothetical protein [Blastocatellia bacterium]
MLTIIWHYDVLREREEEFLKAYGPDGSWRSYFNTCEGYQDSEIFRSLEEPHKYAVFDYWDGPEEYEIAVKAEAYKELSKAPPLYEREQMIARVTE